MTETLLRCDYCEERYPPRPEGDLADLNNLCRDHASECAAQLEIDYALPWGCSDEQRQAALSDRDRPWRCPGCSLVNDRLRPRCQSCGARCPVRMPEASA